MNGDSSPPAPVGSTPSAPAYKNRSAGLVVFGVLTLLLGCLAGLLVLVMAVQIAVLGTAKGTPGLPAILPGIALYGILAAALVWMGVGSIMARRWARALLLIFSWTWLLIGVVSFVAIEFVLTRMLPTLAKSGGATHPPIPPAAMGIMQIVFFLFFGVVLILLPVIWIFFYNSPHVKATCEARDPVARWTDACPLPVLGLSLFLTFSALMMLFLPVSSHGVLPFFGIFLSGAPGTVVCLAVAALWAYAAQSLYKLEERAWWLVLIVMCLAAVSSLATFARHDIMEMYRLMHYPEAQIQQMQQLGFLTNNILEWMTALWLLPFLGYLLWVRKFLRR